MEKETKRKFGAEPKPQMLKDEQIYSLPPATLAQRLKALYGPDGFASAMSSLSAYKNRAGKTLDSQDKDRIDKAKAELRKIYGKEPEHKTETPQPKKVPVSKPAKPKIIGLPKGRS
jgi:hypothetical protein